GPGRSRPLYEEVVMTNAAEGTWTVKVSRDGGGNTGGAYALKLVQATGSGTAMTPGQDYSGSNNRGDVDVYTFTGTAGQPATLTLNATGGNGFVPLATV